VAEMVNQAKLDEAWEIFDKAAGLEERTLAKPDATPQAKRMAVKNADKKLNQAVLLEAEAFGEELAEAA
jgi:hypothetical protein